MTPVIYSPEVQALLSELQKLVTLNEAEIKKISDISKHCLELEIFEDKYRDANANLPAGMNSKVSIAEIAEASLSEGYEELEKAINQIDKARLDSTITDAEAKFDQIKQHLQTKIQQKKELIDHLSQNGEEKAVPPVVEKLGRYETLEQFKTALKIYAKSVRPLTNKLKINCSVYEPKTPVGNSKSKTVEDVIKEMTESFFQEARDQGFKVENCSINIGGKDYTFTDVVGTSDQSKYTSDAKANAANLLVGSHISKCSYFYENMSKADMGALKEKIEKLRAAAAASAPSAVKMQGGKPNTEGGTPNAVNMKGGVQPTAPTAIIGENSVGATVTGGDATEAIISGNSKSP